VRGEGLPGLIDLAPRNLEVVLALIRVIFRTLSAFSISPSTLAQYRRSGVSIPFLASSVASVPIIQAAMAVTIWSRVAGCSSFGSTL
jgi:hypothetical protein